MNDQFLLHNIFAYVILFSGILKVSMYHVSLMYSSCIGLPLKQSLHGIPMNKSSFNDPPETIYPFLIKNIANIANVFNYFLVYPWAMIMCDDSVIFTLGSARFSYFFREEIFMINNTNVSRLMIKLIILMIKLIILMIRLMMHKLCENSVLLTRTSSIVAR